MKKQYSSLRNHYTHDMMRMIKAKLSSNSINPIAYILQDEIRLKYTEKGYMRLFRAIHECIGTFAFACVCNLDERESELYNIYVNQSLLT